eukprot:GEMP01030066.1.p1 GENE.GEMP01030066.1~~GEMP01030066.1.p1  ORF type:complete len:531 (+),score=71.00 GEMP01030066.1:187-1593(+)
MIMARFVSMFALGASADEFLNWSGFDSEPSKRQGPMLDIPHLCFRTPYMYSEEHESEWKFDGAAIPLNKRTLLLPGVPQRAGRISARFPLEAEDFASTFEILVEGDSQEMQSGGGMFFTKSVSALKPKLPMLTKSNTVYYYEELKRSGFGFYGFNSIFQGFGVVFRTHLNGQYSPSVAIVTNDGSRDYSDDRFENKAHMYKNLDFRNANGFVTVRLQVARGIIKVDVHANGVEWIEVGRERLPKLLLGNDRWDVAFSALSSMGMAPPALKASRWFLRDVRVMARDSEVKIKKDLDRMGNPPNATNKAGTPSAPVATWLLEAAVQMSREHVRNDPAQQTKWLMHIAELVDNYLTHEMADHAFYSRSVADILHRVMQVSELHTSLKSEDRPHSLTFGNLREGIDEHKFQQHNEEADTLTIAMEETRSMQQSIMNYHDQLTYMILIVLFAAACLGVMLYRKIRSYEKKHLH